MLHTDVLMRDHLLKLVQKVAEQMLQINGLQHLKDLSTPCHRH